jgi:multisubunit Na+/H+ antiporter MnhG subunit
MSEHELLELLQSYDDAQQSSIAQVISLHLVMIAAVFYFLHRSGLIMKLAVFVLYALGNAMYVALMYNVSHRIVGTREELAALAASETASPITEAVLRHTGESWSNAQAIITNVSFLALWLGTTYLLFFWKRPKDTE